MRVLGIEIDESLVDCWRSWLLPERQPFILPRSFCDAQGWSDERKTLDFEILDAFELYGVAADQAIVSLTRAQSRVLSTEIRQLQRTPHRWPGQDPAKDRYRAIKYVESGRRPSRHTEVAQATWRHATGLLPGATKIAGTFPDRSGPNCFGTVMAAAEVLGAAEEWMQIEPFENWLSNNCVPGGND
ncbi:MAG: hypothetical protein KF742_06785 [Cryobacterium sp.]|nr:hypothetical protein [Cryobacterium sp.]MBX3117053.1 hypothetical protein [Cryobacterium sp.]MCC7128512.1 hypothetical protein [Microbacteriaceae bacterium]